MDVRHLELLRDIADHGSLIAVARHTHRTPSAVSQQLRTAERLAGVALVDQDGRSVRLTDAGRVLADAGRDVSSAIARAQASWDEYRDAPLGTVSVAALPSAAGFLIPPVLQRLVGDGVVLHLTDVDVSRDSYLELTREHDVVIGHRFDERIDSNVIVTPLAREPIDLAMRAGHPLSVHRTITPSEAVAYGWIGVPDGYPFRSLEQRIAEAAGHAPSVEQRLWDNDLIERILAVTDLVALLPRFTSPHTPEVVLRPLDGVEASREIVALMRTRNAQRRAVHHLLDTIGSAHK